MIVAIAMKIYNRRNGSTFQNMKYFFKKTILHATDMIMLRGKLFNVHRNTFDPTLSYFWIENNPDNRRYISSFILIGTWSLMSAILTYSYRTNLISYLTVPLLKPIPNSFDDLAQTTEYKLTLEWDYIITQSILVSWLLMLNPAWLVYRIYWCRIQSPDQWKSWVILCERIQSWWPSQQVKRFQPF